MSSTTFTPIKRESVASDEPPPLLPLSFTRKRFSLPVHRSVQNSQPISPPRRVRVACCRRLVSDFAADGSPICPFHLPGEVLEASESKEAKRLTSMGLYLAGLLVLAAMTSSFILVFRPQSSSLPAPVAEFPAIASVTKEVMPDVITVAVPKVIAVPAAEEEKLRSEIAILREALAEAPKPKLPEPEQPLPVEKLFAEIPRDMYPAATIFGVFLLFGVFPLFGVFTRKTSSSREKALEKELEEALVLLETLRKELTQVEANTPLVAEKKTLTVEQGEAVNVLEPTEEFLSPVKELEGPKEWVRASEESITPVEEEESLVAPGHSEKENQAPPSEIPSISSSYDGEGRFQYEDLGEMDVMDRVTMREAIAMRKHVLRQKRFSERRLG